MSDASLEERLAIDGQSLYLDESFTDLRVGAIRRLTPVDRDGNPDPSRPVRYSGQTQVMTPAGPLPLSFEIPATSLTEAAAGFPEQAEKALEEAVEEIQRLQREQQSQIMVPGRGGSGSGGAGGLPGGGLKL